MNVFRSATHLGGLLSCVVGFGLACTEAPPLDGIHGDAGQVCDAPSDAPVTAPTLVAAYQAYQPTPRDRKIIATFAAFIITSQDSGYIEPELAGSGLVDLAASYATHYENIAPDECSGQASGASVSSAADFSCSNDCYPSFGLIGQPLSKVLEMWAENHLPANVESAYDIIKAVLDAWNGAGQIQATLADVIDGSIAQKDADALLAQFGNTVIAAGELADAAFKLGLITSESSPLAVGVADKLAWVAAVLTLAKVSFKLGEGIGTAMQLTMQCKEWKAENCACEPGASQSCYGGPRNTVDVAACAAGARVCNDGQWGPCVGEVLPGPEVCDGLDNDCDGTTDDGDPGGGVACDTGAAGSCAKGATTCSIGAITCAPLARPSPELCNGEDDDCNGIVDDGDPGGGAGCDTMKAGVCAAGSIACVNGSTVCDQKVQASAETCDGLDDDCDGVVDEEIPSVPCPAPGASASTVYGGSSPCELGLTQCTGGAVVCEGAIGPAEEVPDGVDNDCDGAIDNGYYSGCHVGYQPINQLVDPRDGAKYWVTPIAGQCWMVQDLNYNAPPPSVGTCCYPPPAGCTPPDLFPSNLTCGWRHYTWETAIEDICPPGWHLPSLAEMQGMLAVELEPYVGQQSLPPLFTCGVGEFCASMNGGLGGGTWMTTGAHGTAWTSTLDAMSQEPLGLYILNLGGSGFGASIAPWGPQPAAFSVRCTK